jgi:hypothetical protein
MMRCCLGLLVAGIGCGGGEGAVDAPGGDDAALDARGVDASPRGAVHVVTKTRDALPPLALGELVDRVRDRDRPTCLAAAW